MTMFSHTIVRNRFPRFVHGLIAFGLVFVAFLVRRQLELTSWQGTAAMFAFVLPALLAYGFLTRHVLAIQRDRVVVSHGLRSRSIPLSTIREVRTEDIGSDKIVIITESGSEVAWLDRGQGRAYQVVAALRAAADHNDVAGSPKPP